MSVLLNTLTVSQLQHGLQNGYFSSEEVVDSCLDRIAARNGTLKAWVAVDEAGSRAVSRRNERGGPLSGVPFAAKDVFRTSQLPTEMGSSIYAGATDRFDAAAIGVLRKAGAILLGKTATAEFAGTAPPETCHPQIRTHTPGGSSSGSAAAVADHMVPFALGTQTGGSVIRPAAFCGVVGFKPSFGLYPVDGVKMAAQSFDTVGLFTRAAEDTALIHSALLHGKPALPDGPFQIGVLWTHLADTLLPSTVAAIEKAIALLAEAGCPVTSLEAPPWLKHLTAHRAVINAFERHHALAAESLDRLDDFRPESRATWNAGLDLTEEEYLAALRAVDDARSAVSTMFADIDILVTPATPGEAPEGLHSTGDPRLQELWTTLHVPTICLPTGRGPAGLPLSMQMVAPKYHDTRLLAAAIWTQSKLGSLAT
jgi:Asp-tRNA(Asn)/Glu-tRNA(Gln) amidotransferase A subunit family amidase